MPEDIIKGKIVFEGGGGGLVGVGGASGGGGGAGAEVSGGLAGAAIGLRMKPMLAKLGAIAASVAVLSKASPQLGATLSIMFKSFMLILRPIGDVISMFLRPLAIGLIRFLIPILRKWNQFKKTAVGEVVAPVMGGAVTGAMIGGAIGGLPGAAIGAGIGAAAGLMVVFWDDFKQGIKNIGAAFSSMWDKVTGTWSAFSNWMYENVYLPFLGIWITFKDWMSENVINPILAKWTALVDFINETVVEPIKQVWATISDWIDEHVITPIKTLWGTIATWFDEHIIGPIKDAWETIATGFTIAIIDPITNAWTGLVTAVTDKIDAMFSWFNTVKDSVSNWWDRMRGVGQEEVLGGEQTGGFITKEGLYRLHQGETVIPAHMQGMTNNFTPNITINANIASGMDLQALADQLSGIMMDNLSRRNSYTFT